MSESTSTKKEQIIAFLKNNGPAGIKEITDKTGISYTTVRMTIYNLYWYGMVRQIKAKVDQTTERYHFGRDTITLVEWCGDQKGKSESSSSPPE